MAILCIILIYFGIAALWQIGEKLIYGVVTPRILDDVVAIVLAVSIYFNFS